MHPFTKLLSLGIFLSAALLACDHQVLNGTDGDSDGGCVGPAPEPYPGCPSMCLAGQWVHNDMCANRPCPNARPADGDSCTWEGQICSYLETTYGNCYEDEYYEVNLICTTAGWTTTTTYCSPIECPDSLPVQGADCSDWYDAYACSYAYEDECGPADAHASCDYSTSTWIVEATSACTVCDQHASADTCAANPACRWLVPGCGEPALPVEGCFPADDCAADGCDEGETCTTSWHDPCWNASCDACGAEVQVCLPDAG